VEGLTRRDSREDDAAHALIQTPQGQWLLQRTGCIDFDIILALIPGLEGVQRIDQEVDGECGYGAGLRRISAAMYVPERLAFRWGLTA
jgi:hypothetical protein